MKKRKRKMEENKVKCLQVAFLISGSLLISIINSLSITTSTIVSCQPVATQFDEEHHRLNITQSNSSLNGNIMHTDMTSINLFNNSNRSQIDQPVSSSDSSMISQQQNISKSEYLSDNSLDNDLLAVESNPLSSVGSQTQAQAQKSTTQPPTRDQQTNPPYASNISTTSLSHLARLNSSFLQLTPITSQPLNDTYLLKLYRATNLPSFARDHQQHRAVPIESNIFQTKSHSTHQVINNNNYTSGFKYPYQKTTPSHQQTTNQSLPITSDWHSLYYSANKQTSPQSSSSVQTTTAISDHQLREDVKNFTQQRHDYFKPNISSHTAVSSGIEREGTAKISKSSNFGTLASVIDFPSLLTSSGDGFEEEHFERSLAVGNYQRTNARNMSWSQLLRQASESNIMESLMVTNRSIVSLLCDTDDMLIRFKFKQPFTGSVMTNLDKNKSCRLVGTGGYYYEMRISLNDCGTRQEMPRLFINNILIEFYDSSIKSSLANNQHYDLDIVGNEIKTIICSYPIKPRAPPPPDLPIGLSERIIDKAAAPSEPARLVYYEPLVLISGLLFLSLTLLGLTVSAYMLAKRFKGSRSNRMNLSIKRNLSDSTRGAGFTSSRMYRNSPAQVANFLLAPPLIGSEDDINKTRKLHKLPQTKSVKKYKTVPGRKSGTTNGKRLLNDRFGNVTLTKIGTKNDSRLDSYKQVTQNGFSTVNLNPNDSPDSLADKNDKSSITTIEIPFSTKTKPRGEFVYTPEKVFAASSSSDYSDLGQIHTSKQPTKAKVVGGNFERRGSKSTSPQEFQSKSSRTKLEEEAEENDEKTGRQTTFTRSTKKSSYYKSERLTRTEYPDVESKEIQAGGDTPPFGSLRSKLTSPKEFKRLQAITRMFEEVIVENLSAGNDGTTVGLKIDLKPSKYRNKILDEVEESERRLLANMLAKDELFRSLVVDSINREIFNKKLKESSTYGVKLSESTWRLFEEILLDPDINSAVDSNSIIDHIDSSTPSETDNASDHRRIIKQKNDQKNLRQHKYASEQQAIKKRPEISNEVVNNKESKSDNQVILNKAEDDKNAHNSVGTDNKHNHDEESVLVEIDAHHSDSPQVEQDDSLDSNDFNVREKISTYSKTPKESPKLVAELTTPSNRVQHKDTVRVSQFNSTTKEGGMTGTLINIDSVTNFTSSKDFSTYTKSRIEHTRYDAQIDSLPLFDQTEKVGSYEYAKETLKLSPKLSNNTFNRRILNKRPPLRKFSNE